MITNYDFDKDGKLNMAEYKQYLTESEEGDGMEVKKEDNEEKGKQIESKKNKEEKTEDEDDVVFIVHK